MATRKKVAKKTVAKPKLPYVVLRGYYHGVKCGELVSLDVVNKAAVLRNSRQLWSYESGRHGSCYDVATVGASGKLSPTVPEDVVVTDVYLEVIPATATAKLRLQS